MGSMRACSEQKAKNNGNKEYQKGRVTGQDEAEIGVGKNQVISLNPHGLEVNDL